ncbi:unnamed protein product, partial [Urochloa humidicola]
MNQEHQSLQICDPEDPISIGVKSALRTSLQGGLSEATCHATGMLACSQGAHLAFLPFLLIYQC